MTVSKTIIRTGTQVLEVYTTNLSAGSGQDSYTWTPPSGISRVDVFLVGGGGGGGYSGFNGSGGGGAGGVLFTPRVSISGSITLKVGAGGSSNGNGANSEFSTIIAYGGGKGGAYNNAGSSGGSGGGHGANITSTVASGTSGQGNAGGIGLSGGNHAGGGGGAGGVGSAGSAGGGGAGGPGVNYSGLFGTTVGAGGWFGEGGSGGYGTYGGSHGGGRGAIDPTSGAATSGVNGSGGGGGGGYSTYGTAGGSGGSGIVIIRYFVSGNTVGAGKFTSLFNGLVLWFNGSVDTSDGFPIIPSGVTVTPSGNFGYVDLGNNKSLMNFNGTTNYISLSDNAAWTMFEGDFTISLWVKFGTVKDNEFLGQYADTNNKWTVYWDATTITLYGKIAGTIKMLYSAALAQSSGVWYYVTIIRSGSACLIYVNGASQSVTTTISFTATIDVTGPFEIGRGDTVCLNGNIKDLMIWKNRALTTAEIKMLMIKTHPLTGTGLIPGPYDYWRNT